VQPCLPDTELISDGDLKIFLIYISPGIYEFTVTCMFTVPLAFDMAYFLKCSISRESEQKDGQP
jgi:hypothetical protein